MPKGSKLKIYKKILLLLCLNFIVLASNAQALSEKDRIKVADKLFDKGKYAEAEEHYRALLSLNEQNLDYNFKYGVCLLYKKNIQESKKRLSYVRQANEGEYPEVNYFLGLANHLDYAFDEAIRFYQFFKNSAGSKVVKNLDVNRQIEMCRNGQKLLRKYSEVVVKEKKKVQESTFFRFFSAKDLPGQILVIEDFQMANDKKNEHLPIVFKSNDAQELFFASYDKNDQKDLYRVTKLAGGGWSTPERLPDVINTLYDEDFAFMHPNGKTFYFSSKGHNSMGGYDIFKSDYDPISKTFGQPINLDFNVNSPDDDMFFLLSKDKEYSYFASNRSTPQGDLIVYKAIINTEEIPHFFIALLLDDGKGNQLTNLEFVIKNLKDEIIEKGILNAAKDAIYKIPANGTYVFEFKKENKYKTYSKTLTKPDNLEPLLVSLSFEDNDLPKMLESKTIVDPKIKSTVMSQFFKEMSEPQIQEEIASTKTEETTVKSSEITEDELRLNAYKYRQKLNDNKSINNEIISKQEEVLQYLANEINNAQIALENDITSVNPSNFNESNEKQSIQEVAKIESQYDQIRAMKALYKDVSENIDILKQENNSITNFESKLDNPDQITNPKELTELVNSSHDLTTEISKENKEDIQKYASKKQESLDKISQLTKENDNSQKRIAQLETEIEETKSEERKNILKSEIEDLTSIISKNENAIQKEKQSAVKSQRGENYYALKQNAYENSLVSENPSKNTSIDEAKYDVIKDKVKNLDQSLEDKGLKKDDLILKDNLYDKYTDEITENVDPNALLSVSESIYQNKNNNQNDNNEENNQNDNNEENNTNENVVTNDNTEENNETVTENNQNDNNEENNTNENVVTNDNTEENNETVTENNQNDNNEENNTNENVVTNDNTEENNVTVTESNQNDNNEENNTNENVVTNDNTEENNVTVIESNQNDNNEENNTNENVVTNDNTEENNETVTENSIPLTNEEQLTESNASKKIDATNLNLNAFVSSISGDANYTIDASTEKKLNKIEKKLIKENQKSPKDLAKIQELIDEKVGIQNQLISKYETPTNIELSAIDKRVNDKLEKSNNAEIEDKYFLIKNDIAEIEQLESSISKNNTRDRAFIIQQKNALIKELKALNEQLDAPTLASNSNSSNTNKSKNNTNTSNSLKEAEKAGLTNFTEKISALDKQIENENNLEKRNNLITQRRTIENEMLVFVNQNNITTSEAYSSNLIFTPSNPEIQDLEKKLENVQISLNSTLSDDIDKRNTLLNQEYEISSQLNKLKKREFENQVENFTTSLGEMPNTELVSKKAQFDGEYNLLLKEINNLENEKKLESNEVKKAQIQNKIDAKKQILAFNETVLSQINKRLATEENTLSENTENQNIGINTQTISLPEIDDNATIAQKEEKIIEYEKREKELTEMESLLEQEIQKTSNPSQKEDLNQQLLDLRALLAQYRNDLNKLRTKVEEDKIAAISVNEEQIAENTNINSEIKVENTTNTSSNTEVIPTENSKFSLSSNNSGSRTSLLEQELAREMARKAALKSESCLVYKIQIGAFYRPIPNAEETFNEFKPIWSYRADGSKYIRYYVGEFSFEDVAQKALPLVQQLGYRDAFIVAFCNQDRISLAEARNMELNTPTTITENNIAQNSNNTQVTTNTSNTNSIEVNTTTNTEQFSWLNETKGLIYSVQVGVYQEPISLLKYGVNQPMYERISSGRYVRHFQGIFQDFDAANTEKNRIRNNGIRDAFVVAYHNGQKISVRNARTIEPSNPRVIEQTEIKTQTENQNTEVTQTNSIQTTETDPTKVNALFFTVQIGVYVRPTDLAGKYKIDAVLNETMPNGYLRYYTGLYKTVNAAQQRRDEIRRKGITDAFVTAYYRGSKITLDRAQELINQFGDSIFKE